MEGLFFVVVGGSVTFLLLCCQMVTCLKLLKSVSSQSVSQSVRVVAQLKPSAVMGAFVSDAPHECQDEGSAAEPGTRRGDQCYFSCQCWSLHGTGKPSSSLTFWELCAALCVQCNKVYDSV